MADDLQAEKLSKKVSIATVVGRAGIIPNKPKETGRKQKSLWKSLILFVSKFYRFEIASSLLLLSICPISKLTLLQGL